MMKTVGVQKELSTIRNYLQDNGYKIYEVDTTNITSSTTLKSFDALIVSGANDNIMGFDDTLSKIPVVNAGGLSPVDVKDQLDRTLR